MRDKMMLAFALVGAMTAGACKKTVVESGVGSGGSNGSAATVAPAMADGLESATWKTDKGPGKAGPLKFDRQIVGDDGNGNLQLWLIANCPTIPQDCSMMKFAMLQPDTLEKTCKGWTMVHVAFGVKDQKADMGPLKPPPGKYGYKTEPMTAWLEYTNADRSVGGQSYQETDQINLTTNSDTTMAGTFDTKYEDYAYKGAFTATKCKCDASGACK
jgi:hypothetical protein